MDVVVSVLLIHLVMALVIYLQVQTSTFLLNEMKQDTSSIILARYCIEALEDIHNLFDVMPVTVKEPWVANAKL